MVVLASQVCSVALAAPGPAPVATACPGDTYEKNEPIFLDDPYYPAGVMHSGKYNGMCIDTSWQRPAHVLSKEAAVAAGVPAGYIAFANFNHGGRNWIAQVPMGAVEEVIFQMEHFSFSTPPGMQNVGIPSAHTEIRFKFKKGSEVILIPQSAEAAAAGQASEVRLSDIIYSVELIAPKGVSNFDPINGLKGTFAIVYHFTSLGDKFNYMITQQSHRVEQMPIKVTDEQKQQLLLHAIATSDAMGVSGTYNTALRNCTSEVFKLFDEVLSDAPGYGKPSTLEKILSARPGRSKKSLTNRGLLDPAMTWPDLNDEKDIVPAATTRPAAPGLPEPQLPQVFPSPKPSN